MSNLIHAAIERLEADDVTCVAVLYHRLEADRVTNDFNEFLKGPHASKLRIALETFISLDTGKVLIGVGSIEGFENRYFDAVVPSERLRDNTVDKLMELLEDNLRFMGESQE